MDKFLSECQAPAIRFFSVLLLSSSSSSFFLVFSFSASNKITVWYRNCYFNEAGPKFPMLENTHTSTITRHSDPIKWVSKKQRHGVCRILAYAPSGIRFGSMLHFSLQRCVKIHWKMCAHEFIKLCTDYTFNTFRQVLSNGLMWIIA